MSTARTLPVRVLVKGSSLVGWLGRMGGPRSDFGFPRAIEAGLLAAGRPATVQTISVAAERTNSTLLHWEREILGFSPDVIVLVYGYYESMHLFLPWWFERHANSLRTRHRRVTDLYRTMMVRKAWMASAKAQAWIDKRVDPTFRRGVPRRVARDLETLIKHALQVGSPVVYVFELLPPGSRYQSWFPGMARRIEVMNVALEDVVLRFARPEVRYFRTSEVVASVAGGDLDVAQPDGFHYSAELHGAVGRQLAAEIDTWAATQDHLTIGALPRSVQLVEDVEQLADVDVDVAGDGGVA